MKFGYMLSGYIPKLINTDSGNLFNKEQTDNVGNSREYFILTVLEASIDRRFQLGTRN